METCRSHQSIGFIGSNLRYFTGKLVHKFSPTAFSTFSLETASLFKQGMGLHAGLNILLNIVPGFAGVLAGMGIGRLVPGK